MSDQKLYWQYGDNVWSCISTDWYSPIGYITAIVAEDGKSVKYKVMKTHYEKVNFVGFFDNLEDAKERVEKVEPR